MFRSDGYDDAHGGIDALITKMRGLAHYPGLFAFVYGDATITEDRIQRAVAQYVRSIVSVNSKFDQGFAQVFNPQTGDRGLGAPFPGHTQGKTEVSSFPPTAQSGWRWLRCMPRLSDFRARREFAKQRTRRG